METDTDEHECWLEENFAFNQLPDNFELPCLAELALRGSNRSI